MEERASEQEREVMMAWLEGELGPLSQIVKSNIREDAASYYHGDEEERRMLLDHVRGLRNVDEGRTARVGAARTGRGEERGGLPEIEVQVDEYTRRRGEVFAELLGLHPDVRKFREVLRGYPLSEEEASEFLERKGAAQRRLRKLTGRLARRYAWREPQAERFVLTGRAPQPVGAAVSFTESVYPVPDTARIIITADVWVDADEVGRAFQAAQRQLLGGDNRKASDKVLEVARFVARRVRDRGETEPWRERWKAWNEEHPNGWRYAAPHGFKQAFERFVHPVYARPKFKRR